MVVCKYFQQGTCRYGQYCRFEHSNNYVGNQGNSNKTFADAKSIVLGVAEEVLAAERGGQWLLSCFGPFKEQACIPGMDDVSPEEVRWEIYQAQKNGTVDQMKLQFQQLCQAMSVKRDALKNPTHETASMLDKLQKSNRESNFGGKTNFALSTPQMSQSSNTVSSSNVFGARTAANNPFGGGFNTSPAVASSIFGRTTTSNSSVFGAKASFGGNAMFGNQTNTSTVFGGSTSNSGGGGNASGGGVVGTVFGGNQSMQTFATVNPPTNSVFGGGTFGSTNQAASGPFSMSPSSQPATSVFGTTTTATNSGIFGAQTSTLFGAAKNTANPFGATNSMFGSSTVLPANTAIGGTIFGKTNNTAEFGGAAVFGASSTGQFASGTGESLYGGQPGFADNSQISGNNPFGVTSAQATTFGSTAQSTNSFAALAAPPFGTSVSSTNSTPFATQSGPFGSVAGSPFARPTGFGPVPAASGESAFSTTSGANAFGGNLATPVSQTFGASVFGNSAAGSPFASTTSTTTTSNPFAPRSQQQMNTPFGIAQTCTVSSGNAFGQSITTASIIDETAYTIEGKLTDDEKSLYLADQFILGKIPVKPPTIELR